MDENLPHQASHRISGATTRFDRVSAYIDLNPVRAGMVEDPADYRWSSYGEAIG